MSFISKLVSKSPRVTEAINELRGTKGELLPIILYGAGVFATRITNLLKKHNLQVNAYCVSDGYEKSPRNQYQAHTLDNITKLFPEFNIVIALSSIKKIRQEITKKLMPCIKGVYAFAGLLETVDLDHARMYEKELEEVYNMFEDRVSKETLLNVVNARLTTDQSFLEEVVREDQYFSKDVVRLSREEVFVDAGAFNGDTLLRFLDETDSSYTHYHAFEPDALNCEELAQTIRVRGVKNITIHRKGLWCDTAMLSFAGGNETYSSLCSCNYAPPSAESDVGTGNVVDVQVDTVDRICPEATFIKMDIQGAELEALKGAANTIYRNHPKLAICVYHKFEHLFEIPLFIKALVPDYRFYLRHHSELENETVLYAVP